MRLPILFFGWNGATPHRHQIMRLPIPFLWEMKGQHHTDTELYARARQWFFGWETEGNTTPTPNNAIADDFFYIGGATLHWHRIMRSPIPFLWQMGGQHHTNTDIYARARQWLFGWETEGNTTPTPNYALADDVFYIGGATLHWHRIMRTPIPFLWEMGGQHHTNTELYARARRWLFLWETEENTIQNAK